MSNFKIVGNANPAVGQKEMYSVADTFSVNMPTANTVTNNPLFPEAKVNWSMQQLVGGNWIVKENTKKTGNEVPYTFTEATLEYDDLKIVAKKNGQEVSIKIKPKKSLERKIVTVTFLDENWNPPKRRFAYGDKIIARIHCVNLDGCHGKIVLYEDDEPYNVNTDYNRNNKFTTVPIFIEDGKAEAHFILNPNFAKLANSYGDKDHGNQEGEFHEYYITVEIFNQKPFESQNIEVQNPDYNDPQILRKNFHNNSRVNYYETKVEVLAQIREIGDSIREITNKALMVDVPDGIEGNDGRNGTCVCKEYNFHWSNQLTCKERQKVLEVCANLWGEENKKQKASELMAIIHLETAATFKPSADNGINFSGLIQFSDTSAKSLGTTRAALKAMTFIEQMKYVKDYFFKKKEFLTTMTDLYLLVLKPNAVGNGSDPNYVVFDESIAIPDGDGSNTSPEQRKINIGREPWVTKYGYSSNPSFMKGEEHTLRKKWVYTRQQFEDRWGFIDGKTTINDVTKELLESHYNPGAKELFVGECKDVSDRKSKQNSDDRAPWMKIAIEAAKEMKGCPEGQEPMYSNAKKYLKYCGNNFEPTDGKKGPWCAAFMNWSIGQTINTESGKSYKHSKSPSSLAPIGNDKKLYKKIENPIYGCIVVYKHITEWKGHTGFLYGKTKDGEYILLGGNQIDTIRFDSYGEYTSKFKKKKIYGFYLPEDYKITSADELTEEDFYKDSETLNTNFGIITKESDGKTN